MYSHHVAHCVPSPRRVRTGAPMDPFHESALTLHPPPPRRPRDPIGARMDSADPSSGPPPSPATVTTRRRPSRTHVRKLFERLRPSARPRSFASRHVRAIRIRHRRARRARRGQKADDGASRDARARRHPRRSRRTRRHRSRRGFRVREVHLYASHDVPVRRQGDAPRGWEPGQQHAHIGHDHGAVLG